MIPLTLLPNDNGSRVGRDRLELITALVNAPGFDPIYRADIIKIPPQHPVYGWECVVEGCVRIRRLGVNLCYRHITAWNARRDDTTTMASFLAAAKPFPGRVGFDLGVCRICPDRPAHSRTTGLCQRHTARWGAYNGRQDISGPRDFETWLASQDQQLRGYGLCGTAVCTSLADSPLGMCFQHRERYRRQGRPGGATLPQTWYHRLEPRGLPVPILYEDEAVFRRWCAIQAPAYRVGEINVMDLHPLVKTEIQWGFYAHAQVKNRSRWELGAAQRLVNCVRRHRVVSLVELNAQGGDGLTRQDLDSMERMVCGHITAGLRCVYNSPADTRDAGFIETDHFGRRFTDAVSHFDISAVSQRWLRDMLWDQMAEMLRGEKPPRSRNSFEGMRRACVELSAFLEVDAPDGGHDPTLLCEEHAQRFVIDQRHRARHGLESLGLFRKDGKPGTVTDSTHRLVFNYARKILHTSLTTGQAAQFGLDNGFIAAMPNGIASNKRSRTPFSDELARALADQTNLGQFSETYDPNDRGLRDIWEAIVVTGRRPSEVIKLRLDCIGHYRGLPMLWHDQTKVGNFDEAIRIPESLYALLDERRRKTLIRFEHRQGRMPTMQERARIALFPSPMRNHDEEKAVSYTFFYIRFKAWVESLALGKAVAHQARHTLATNLLRAGANLSQIRRYLGQVSDRMAEHYVKIANTELEDVLHAVWVAGPGAPHPGELLSGEFTSLTRGEAMALALDVSRRSTPADGGFCTFQPVVQGGACPWKLDCENCDKFVLSGADLLYWRRKQEQWRSLAERAPDDATADYLHQVFEPTARAIAGLEKALAGLGLLEEALAMDLRRPQDYFHRIWSTNFRATDLAAVADNEQDDEDGEDEHGDRDDFNEEQPA
ncbi:tyrosine-type recombinase/integrase [Sciscionella marina]|uniref:tyrosine-type recombinase/integrase n=1 Tax=Sciscionella marina TaxID=508770 RepID=UPI0009FD3C75|nr:site-specific integrase [Sciscionella marina]